MGKKNKKNKPMSMLERWAYDEEHYMDNLFGGGLAQGPWVSYYDNGLKKEEGNYKDGRQIGKWIFYNEDGSIKEIKEF